MKESPHSGGLGCSEGHGSHYTRTAIQLAYAKGGISDTHLINPEHVEFSAFCEKLQATKPKTGAKDGSYFCRGPVNGSGERANENIPYADVAILDGDSRITEDGETEKGAPHPSLVHDVLKDADIAHAIFTTHSHRPDFPRYRVVVPARLDYERELAAVVDWLLNLLHREHVPLAPVKENLTWAQAWYYPRLSAPDSEYLTYVHDTDERLDVAEIMDWYEARHEPPPKADRSTVQGDTPWGWYNQRHGTPEAMRGYLEGHGYLFARESRINGETAYRFLHPESETGQPGVRLFKGKAGGWIVVSSHGADKLNDGHSHDAFSVFTQLEHGGETGAAVKALQPIGCTPAQEKWPEPLHLPELRPPVPPFEEALLPERLRPWLADVTQRMQCPPEFPAVGALVSLASLVGRQVGIRPKRYDDWLVVPNLWGAVVGRPGVMKTPALEEPMKPLHRLKHAAIEAHKEAMAEHEALEVTHAALLEAAKKALQGEAKKKVASLDNWRSTSGAVGKQADTLRQLQEDTPQPPVMHRYMTNDTTPEKLGELLSENPKGMLVYRDELVSWLRGLDKQGREEGRGFYLQGWNGTGGYTFDRIVRGTVHIEAVCLSILGGIQPGPLSEYVWQATHGGAGNDGLLQRFQLLVWPDDTGSWRNVDRWPDTAAKNTAFAVFDRLDVIDARAIRADTSEGIPFLRFSDEAQELFDEWRTELETVKLRRGAPEALESHLAKYRSLAPSLALLSHLIDDNKGPVTIQAAARAFDWCEFLEAHARRVYGAATIRGLDSAHALAAKIREGRLPAEFKPRDVYLKGWSRLDKDGVAHALDVLSDCNWVRVRTVPPGPSGGRPSKFVTANPSLGVSHG